MWFRTNISHLLAQVINSCTQLYETIKKINLNTLILYFVSFNEIHVCMLQREKIKKKFLTEEGNERISKIIFQCKKACNRKKMNMYKILPPPKSMSSQYDELRRTPKISQ